MEYFLPGKVILEKYKRKSIFVKLTQKGGWLTRQKLGHILFKNIQDLKFRKTFSEKWILALRLTSSSKYYLYKFNYEKHLAFGLLCHGVGQLLF